MTRCAKYIVTDVKGKCIMPKMNAIRAQELLPPLKNGAAIGISLPWRMRLIEALEYVIEHDVVKTDDVLCESCGAPANSSVDLCRGCGAIVCVQCAMKYDHLGDGKHGFKKVKK